jgi:non-specific serine/threonine protein kinase
MDNCEHLVEAAAQMAETLLGRCPRIRLLATSRERLKIPGERVFQVPSLPEPEAMRLFVDRAAMSRATWALSDRNAPAVAKICQRLDGIPLALELAAAQVSVLTPDDVLARLDDRFRLLASGARTALPRQQTLRAAVEWSHNLLGEAEKKLFRRLSVFAGGFDLEAAEAVCSADEVQSPDVLGLLAGLVEKSLVVADEGAFGRARYRLLETLREFAREQLTTSGENEAHRRRHADYCLRLADGAAMRVRGAQAETWLARMDEEHDNLRAALAWAIQGDRDLAMQLSSAWAPFWLARGHLNEGRDWLAAVLKSPSAVTAGTDGADGLAAAAKVALYQSDFDRARQLGQEGLTGATSSGDLRLIGDLRNVLGVIALYKKDYILAKSHFESSQAAWREAGEPDLGTPALANLGLSEAYEGDHRSARARLQASMDVYERVGDALGKAVIHQYVAMLDLREQELSAAEGHLRDSLAILREVGDRPWLVGALRLFSVLAGQRAEADRAMRLVGAASTLSQTLGATPIWSEDAEANEVLMRGLLGSEAAAAAFEAGQRMTLAAAVAHALGTDGIASEPEEPPSERRSAPGSQLARVEALRQAAALAYFQGDLGESRLHIEEGLSLMKEGDSPLRASLINLLGNVAIDQGDAIQARSYWEQSLAIAHRCDDLRGEAVALGNLGGAAERSGDFATARNLKTRSVALMRQAGDRTYEAKGIMDLAILDVREGQLERAGSQLTQAMTLVRELGEPLWTAQVVSSFGFLAAAEMQPERALVLLAAADALRKRLGSAGVFPSNQTEREATFDRMRGLLGSARGEAAWEKGRNMTIDQAVEYALSASAEPGPTSSATARIAALLSAAELAHGQSDLISASNLCEEALQLARQVSDRRGEASALYRLGTAVQVAGDYDAAAVRFSQSLALWEELGDEGEATRVRMVIAFNEISRGNLDVARRLYVPVLKRLREGNDRQSLALALFGAAQVSIIEGAADRARQELSEGLELVQLIGDKVWIVRGLNVFAWLAVSQSDAEHALRLRAAAETIAQGLGMKGPYYSTTPQYLQHIQPGLERMREILGHGAAAAAEDKGRQMSLEEACEFALTEV